MILANGIKRKGVPKGTPFLMRLKSSFFEVLNQFHIEFPDIESRDIFPIQVDHVRMGNTSVAVSSEQGVFLVFCILAQNSVKIKQNNKEPAPLDRPL